MTMMIKTQSGEEIDTGFWGPDTSRIQLGELPPMPTRQFVGYAASLLVEHVIPAMAPDSRRGWTRHIQDLHQRIGSLPVGYLTGEHLDDGSEKAATLRLAAEAIPLDPAGLYIESPFQAQDHGHSVAFVEPGDGVKHVVHAEDFLNLTYNIINGGWLGWDERGTYTEVQAAAAKLNDALSS